MKKRSKITANSERSANVEPGWLAAVANGHVEAPPAAVIFCGNHSLAHILSSPLFRKATQQHDEPVWLVFSGARPAAPLATCSNRIVSWSLSRPKYQAVIEGLADDGRDAGPCILHLDAPARPPSQAKRILITSTYDESQQARLDEYVECVRRNARNFDILLFLYERSSNRFAAEIAELFHNAADHESAQPLFLDINSRPTFEQLFATADYLFPGEIIALANADIVFDDTLRAVTPEALEGAFFALSRYEATAEGSKSLIENHHGLSNTMSADVWMYRAPRRHRFRAEYPIGTYQCDSFLNYHIGNSGYRLYNPCLSVRTLHLHNPTFNSSEAKAASLSQEIQAVLAKETELNHGTPPLCGIQWCRLDHAREVDLANRLIPWTPNIGCIDVEHDGSNVVAAIIACLMLLRVFRQLQYASAVYFRVSADANAEISDLLLALGTLMPKENLHVSCTTDTNTPAFRDSPAAFQRAHCELDELAGYYKAVIEANPLGSGPIATALTQGTQDPKLLCAVHAGKLSNQGLEHMSNKLAAADKALLDRAIEELVPAHAPSLIKASAG